MATRTPIRTFTARTGVTFVVRVIPTGGRYCGTLVTLEPMIEFYDATYADDRPGERQEGVSCSGFGALGQFVSRVYAATLLGSDRHGPGEGPINLDSHPVWQIDASTAADIRTWVTGTAGVIPGAGSVTLVSHKEKGA